MQGGVEDVGETLSQLKVAMGKSLFRHAVANSKVVDLKEAFASPVVELGLIKRFFCKSEEDLQLFLGGSKLHKTVSRCRGLVCWLTWVYQDLNPERYATIWNHMEKKRYHTGNLKATSKFRLSEQVTVDMFIHLRDQVPRAYLKSTGITPFFTRAAFLEDRSLCEFLRSKLEDDNEDTDNDKNTKKRLRACTTTFTGKHQTHEQYLCDLYDDPKEALKLAKRLITSLGFRVESLERRRYNSQGARKRTQVVQIPSDILALTFTLKPKFSLPILELLPTLLGTANLADIDKEWVRDSVKAYNEECANANEMGRQIHCESEGNVRSAGVISSRVREANAERSLGGHTTTNRVEDQHVSAARDLLHL